LRNLLEKPSTLRFPYERMEPVERMRAKVSWQIDKCIGCSLCVKVCPSAAIKLIGRGRKAEIEYNVGRCIFCGECVEICPTQTIFTTKEYELTFTRTRQMVTRFRRTKKKRKASSKK